MKRVAFFNNKGGVGKTTLVCNIAHHLAAKQGRKVLLIDLDPQCNSTQLIMSEEECGQLYWPEETEESYAGEIQTIYDSVRPLEEGEGTPAPLVPTSSDSNRFGIDIVPGHPRMSVFEDQLGQWFRDAQSGDVAGLRKTLWLDRLLEGVKDQYEIVLFDLGPSLGALNRSVLISSDSFVTPMGADIFSIVALRNISEWVSHWARLFSQGVALCNENNEGAANRYGISGDVKVLNGFAGYTVQQYSTVTIRGDRRATMAYEEILKKIPAQIQTHMEKLTMKNIVDDQVKLGDIPNLRSLIPLAQSAHSPLAELNSRDGLTGGQYAQQRTYVQLIDRVARQMAKNCMTGEIQ